MKTADVYLFMSSVDALRTAFQDAIVSRKIEELKLQAFKTRIGEEFFRTSQGLEILHLTSELIIADQKRMDFFFDLIQLNNVGIIPSLPPHLRCVCYIDISTVAQSAVEMAQAQFNEQEYLDSLNKD